MSKITLFWSFFIQIDSALPHIIHPFAVLICVRLNRLKVPLGKWDTFSIAALFSLLPRHLSQILPDRVPVCVVVLVLPLLILIVLAVLALRMSCSPSLCAVMYTLAAVSAIHIFGLSKILLSVGIVNPQSRYSTFLFRWLRAELADWLGIWYPSGLLCLFSSLSQ
jgi:hypothetical protein